MSNATNSIRKFSFGFFIFSGFIFFTSCNNQAEQQLLSLTNLVPRDSLEQIAYIQQAIITYNEIQGAINTENMIGKRISPAISDEITSAHSKECGPTKAVFFSFSKILASISQISPAPDYSKAGIAIHFGKYPAVMSPALAAELTSAGMNVTTSANMNTVVLKYVSDVTASNGNQATYLKDATGALIIDDMGRHCPAYCPQ
jgi:hypothetical protein